MRLLFSLSCFFLFLSFHTRGQNSPDCRTAIPVCADGAQVILPFVDGNGDINDFGDDDNRPSGCFEKGSNSSLNIENNTSWYVFRAGTGGQVGFDIKALCTNGSENCEPTAEWDFAVYGPDVECGAITNREALPIRCNIEVNGTNYTGVGVNPENGQIGAPFLTGSQNTYDEWLEVQPGEVYYILINNYNTNFDDDPEPFELTFTGNSVVEDQNMALDCTLRDEFLGLDIIACEGDPDIDLSALNSPVGSDIASVVWTVDYEDDGVIDATLPGSGDFNAELIVSSPNSGRYFAVVTANDGTVAEDVGGILISFYGVPILDRIERLDTNLSADPDKNNIEVFVDGNSSYEYAINGGDFQDSPLFTDIPPGPNTLIINDKNGCGTTRSLNFLVVSYPKFFTPNGDLRNDTWNIFGIPRLLNPRIYIYDRYGKLLKQLDGTVGWNGTFNGAPMPSSDYWFRFDYNEEESGVIVAKMRKTHFTLKR